MPILFFRVLACASVSSIVLPSCRNQFGRTSIRMIGANVNMMPSTTDYQALSNIEASMAMVCRDLGARVARLALRGQAKATCIRWSVCETCAKAAAGGAPLARWWLKGWLWVISSARDIQTDGHAPGTHAGSAGAILYR